MSRRTRTARIPADAAVRIRELAVALTTAEGRIVPESEVRARVVDAGIVTLSAQLTPRRAA